VVGLGFGSPKSQDFLGFGVFSRTLMEADILWGFFWRTLMETDILR
jgi:hypothetical protein